MIYRVGSIPYDSNYLEHFGILGMKWGVRRYQNPDGSLTEAGKARYGSNNGDSNLVSNTFKLLKNEKKREFDYRDKLKKAATKEKTSRFYDHEKVALLERRSEGLKGYLKSYAVHNCVVAGLSFIGSMVFLHSTPSQALERAGKDFLFMSKVQLFLLPTSVIIDERRIDKKTKIRR